MSEYNTFATVYDSLTKNVEYKKRAEYIYSLLKKHGAEKGILLDLACGTGSLTEYFKEYGYDIIGVDNSPAMLNEAKEKLNDSLLLCQSMTELDLYGTIDCAICTLDSINHLTKISDVRKAFDLVSLFMNPKGVFIFDVNTVYKHRNILANNTFVYDTDSEYCIWQNQFVKKTDTVNIHLDIFKKNQEGTYSKFKENFRERAYSLDDIAQWLNYSGFSVAGIYDELTENPPEENSQRVYFIAIKKE